MITRTFTSLAVMAALGVFLPVSNSHAFGLGKIELSSALNQPFRAQIPITALREEEKGNIQVKLASASEFERAGLERSFYLTQFEFTVVENNGTTSIDIRSRDAVKEPFIDLLLTATAGNGRLIREYTVLLDPPKDIFVKQQTKVQTVANKPTQTVTTAPTSSKSTKYSSDSSYGPTDRNDTLWKIALKIKQNDATVHQMMMALLDENPEAFTNNNINGLKAGFNLDIPAETSIKKRSKSEAISAVAQQNTVWKNRNAKPIAATTLEPVTSPTENSVDQPATEQVTMSAKDDGLVESIADTTARLKLVAPSEDDVSSESEMSPMGDDKLTDLTEQLTLAQETIETQTQENIDIKSRMAAMEEQIETLRRLLSLKDPDLALLQNRLEQQAKTDELSDEAVQTDAIDSSTSNDMSSDTQVTDSNVLEDNNQETVEDDMLSADSQEQISDETLQTQASANDAESDATQAQESDQTNAPIEQALNSVDGAISYVSDLAGLDQEQIKSKYEQVKSYVTEHKQVSIILAGLVLLLLIWLVIRMRNRPYVTWDQAINDTPAKVSATTETQRSQDVDIDVDEVSSVEAAEPEKTLAQLVNDADVYVSYGDFTKAKQTLQSAHAAEPMNEEVIHKLLFVLFKQSQINEFVELANYYQDQTNAPEWDEVVSWGQELAPQEALFQSALSETIEQTLLELPSNEVVDTLDLDENNQDLDISSSNTDIDDELLAFDINQNSSDDDIALDLTDEVVVADVSDDDDRLSLPEVEPTDIDEVDAIETESDIASNASGSDDTIEFDLDLNNNDQTFELDGLDSITEGDLTEANAALSEAELDFDLGDFDQVDEAETKLDLAAAYIDMDDPDGAKSILEEVLTEGNDDQKTRAETMLSGIK